MGLSLNDIPKLIKYALKGNLVGFDIDKGVILVDSSENKRIILESGEFDVAEENVRVVGKIRALSAFFPRERKRPLTQGISIGVKFPSDGIDAGTLSWCENQDGITYCASNAHVLTPNPSQYPLKYRGLNVYQPSLLDGGTDNDIVGQVYAHMRIIPMPSWLRYVPFMWKWFANTYDLGLFTLKTPDYVPLITKPIIGVVFAGDDAGNGYVINLTAPHKPMTFYGYKWQYLSSNESVDTGSMVTKTGRTTGVTYGFVVSNSAVITVDYGSFIALFRDVIMVRPQEAGKPFSQPGDSGSPVWKVG